MYAPVNQWIRTALACCLFSAKPLSKPMLGYCELKPLRTNFSNFLMKIQIFSFTKRLLNILSAKCGPFLSRGRWVNTMVADDARKKATSAMLLKSFPRIILAPGGLNTECSHFGGQSRPKQLPFFIRSICPGPDQHLNHCSTYRGYPAKRLAYI